MKVNNSQSDWHLIDAKDQVLGRLATKIADRLRGKLKTNFSPNQDNGDYVVVVNANKFIMTGRKEDQKNYYSHTGYLGNLKVKPAKELKQTNPEFMIMQAVSGMLPKNKLRQLFLKRLKIYSGEENPHKEVKFIEEGK